MKPRSFQKKLFCLLLAFVVMASVAMPTFAAAPKTVRIGCFDIENFLVLEDDGSVTGYGADYLEEIAKHTGYQYEYVRGTWTECLQWLKSGKIDLLFPAEFSAERAKDFEFTQSAICVDYVSLIANSDNDNLYYGDYKNYNGIVVGMISDNYLNGVFAEFAAKNDFSFTPVYYDTFTEMYAALENKQIDVMISGNLSLGEHQKVIAKFGYLPAFFIAQKGNTQLVEELNEALFRIQLEQPQFAANLIEKYYGAVQKQVKSFSREELAFIKTCAPLTVVCDAANYPFEWYDTKEKKFFGVDADVLAMVSEKTGLTFNIKHTASLTESWEQMQYGKADIIAGVYGDELLSKTYNLRFTDTYMHEERTAVGRRNNIITPSNALTVAMPRSLVGTCEYLRTEYPHWNVINSDTTEDCLQMVADGKADITLVGSLALQTLAYLPERPALAVVSTIGISVPIRLGVSDSQPPILTSILNKAVCMLSSDDIERSVIQNTALHKAPFSVSAFVRQNLLLMIVALIGICIAVGICLSAIYANAIKTRQNKVLAEKNAQLAQAYRIKSDFLSRMSHEIRTPMNAVIGIAHLGHDGENTAVQSREYFEKIENSGKYLLGLINDILDMSRLETGKIELHNEPVNGNKTLQSVLTMMEPLLYEKQIHLVTNFNDVQTPWALCDKMRMQQIFINLLNNAIKFSPVGGTIEFSVKMLENDGASFTFSITVKDYGCGMSEDFQKRMFLPFEQEENTAMPQQNGSGLGLAIIKSIIDEMGGTIAVDSKLGSGTTVTVVLTVPLCDAPATVHDAADVAQTDKLCGKRVLLAEDHDVNALIATTLLTKQGVLVERAKDGQAAIDLFTQAPEHYYQAILMDIRMPICNGLQATQAIRACHKADAATIPIIAMTANAFSEDIEKSRQAGMNAHLAKPIEPDLLLQTLAQWM
ncbi:MAG: transporter substrate-binding domain-containing protein [Ruthenibacterium sp.]